LYIV